MVLWEGSRFESQMRWSPYLFGAVCPCGLLAGVPFFLPQSESMQMMQSELENDLVTILPRNLESPVTSSNLSGHGCDQRVLNPTKTTHG